MSVLTHSVVLGGMSGVAPALSRTAVAVAAALVVAVVATRRSGRHGAHECPGRSGCRIFFLAMVLLGLGGAAGSVGTTPVGSLPAAGVDVAGRALAVAGLAMWLGRRPGARVAAGLLEAGIVSAVVTAFLWVLFVEPAGPGWGHPQQLALLVSMAADLVLLWLALRSMGTRATGPERAALVAALSFLIAADAVVLGSAVTRSAVPWPDLIVVVRSCAYALCAVAVLRHREETSEDVGRPDRFVLPSIVLMVGVLGSPAMLTARAVTSARVSLPAVVAAAVLAGLTVAALLEQRRRTHSDGGLWAHTDALTGLVNRTLFEDRIGRAITHAQREETELAVMFVDLDQFKLVNDSLGHSTGNELLQTLATRLQRSLRAEDTAARLGGDEFGILLPKVSSNDDWGVVADKVLSVIHEPFFIHGRELVVSASIGVAVFPVDGEDAMALIDHADTAMYRAKAAGGGKRRYSSKMSTRSQMRLSIESNLRLAMERGELCLHYQPKVDRNLRIVGLEALLRWYHPRLGLISPSGFIPLAEETGLIVPMGEWVLDAACRDARSWRDSGAPAVPIAVNLSPRQLMTEDFESVVASTLTGRGVTPAMIELEVTESLFLGDQNAARDKLLKLRDMGVHCSIDDFGTGYSTLAYLARLPIESLKIDRSFVQGIGTVLGDSLVEAIIALAHNLKVKVVAEGVESERQARFLDTRGCEEFQGYLFSQPVDFETMGSLLRVDGGVLHPSSDDELVTPPEGVSTTVRPRSVDALIERVCVGDEPQVDEHMVQEVLEELRASEAGDRLRRRLLRLRPPPHDETARAS